MNGDKFLKLIVKKGRVPDMKRPLLDATCRVAFAGLIHDLGKFAQRAKIDVAQSSLQLHQQIYCPQRQEGGRIWWTHQHAAYTGLAFDALERAVPDLLHGDSAPFASVDDADADVTDSLVNAASAHHAPRTLLQWIVATADRVASGFEREEYEDDQAKSSGKSFIQTRLRSLFEEVQLGEVHKPITNDSLQRGFSLRPFSAASLFPESIKDLEKQSQDEASSEYRRLWQGFIKAVNVNDDAIPGNHRTAWPLWLDAFDSAWLTYTQAIPSATAFNVKPDVSLYDHSKATAALAAALWRWHQEEEQTGEEAVKALKERSDWDEQKFLLIQGDFFGIQNFIFSEGSETNKKSAKILRGRSFYVSLLTELAALKVLEALQLPSTSQIINAAGKFLIVAPNTASVQDALEKVREEMEAWFLKHTFGTCGIGLASVPAACRDFKGKNYEALTDRLFRTMERAKFQRFHLTNMEEPVFRTSYPHGPCKWQERLPADGKADGESSPISRDQVLIGRMLTSRSHLVITREEEADLKIFDLKFCEVPVFGYRVAFANGDVARKVPADAMVRCWDFALPKMLDEVLWHGFARRNINGYIPRYSETDLFNEHARFGEDDDLVAGAVKTFETLSLAHSEDNKGVRGLMTLKGDVDNLGLIFRRGLADDSRVMTFAKTATLSRTLNAFFAVYLPVLCADRFRNVYTVFAGGDDFLLIGPWRETQKLARTLDAEFKRFVAENPDVHFSVGMVMTKPSVPSRTLARIAEEALGEAKSSGKNAVSLYGQTVKWTQFAALAEAEDFMDTSAERYGVTTSYLYGLFQILDMAGDKSRPEAAMWRSRLYYNTTRLFERLRVSESTDTRRARDEFLQTLLGYMEKHGAALRIPLTNTFYAVRRINE